MEEQSITILHLSDIQFGLHHRFGMTVASFDGEWDTLFERIKLDLAEMNTEFGLLPDLVVITGDLVEWGKKTEFQHFFEFINKISYRIKSIKKLKSSEVY